MIHGFILNATSLDGSKNRGFSIYFIPMRRHHFAAIALVALATAAFAITGSEEQPRQTTIIRSSDEENAALKMEIQRLNARLAALEQRLVALEKQSRRTPQVITNFQFTLPPQNADPQPRQGVIIPKGGVQPERKPPNRWGEGEVNGWKYYKIPLGSAAAE